jgi:hypothetical protein
VLVLTTKLVSVDVSGTNFAEGPGKTAKYPLESSYPIISANGRWVAFQSSATNLVSATDTNLAPDVFVRDLQSNVTYLVSINADNKPLSEWKVPARDKGDHWLWTVEDGRKYRIVKFDSNHWKSQLRNGFRAAIGDAGCISLPGAPEDHRVLADNLIAEFPVEVSGRGRKLEVWKAKPGRDNHHFDNLVGCLVAGSVLGAILPGSGRKPPQGKPKKPPRKKVTYLE